jgi:transcriptional regulator with PAS, ATPase and Fis domain
VHPLQGSRAVQHLAMSHLFTKQKTQSEKHPPHRRFVELYATPINDAEVSPLFLLQVDDITDWKNREDAVLNQTQRQLEKEKENTRSLQDQLALSPLYASFITCSPLVKKALDNLQTIASSSAATLILGESGTGKELIARAIHEMSPRKEKPFIALNCSAFPENLLEAELFGYAQGAFTDAKKSASGKIVAAEGGTLFLGEIGDVPLAIQVKLLRFLQEKTLYPLGSNTLIQANVRIITATNRDLTALVAQGLYRQDFFYRINVLKISLPPLRDRTCDIPLLCEHFMETFSKKYSKEIKAISSDALTFLMVHSFPGNVRELENIMEQACVICTGSVVEKQHIFLEQAAPLSQIVDLADHQLNSVEREHIMRVLSHCSGNKAKAAKMLGMHRTTLFRKLKELTIT